MRALILMTKAPRPGLAKTRLARGAGIGAEGAADLARAFLADTLRHMRAVPDAERVVVFAPPGAEAELRPLDPLARYVPQIEGPLGERLAAAFDAVFARGCERALVLGNDTPQLGAPRLEQAFDALHASECVLGPSEDGGFYLLGLRAPCARLFEGISWGSERVYGETLARAGALGLEIAELPREFDVNEPRDLDRLRGWIAREGAECCPETARELARLDSRNAVDGGAR